MVGSGFVCIPATKAYPGQNAHDFRLGRDSKGSSRRVKPVEDEAAAAAGKTAQRESIPMLLKETPYLCLFPAPTPPQCLQGQHRTVPAILDRRSQKRERIVRLLPDRVAPEVEPCVRFFKFVMCRHQSPGNAARQAEKTIPIRGIYCLSHASLASAVCHPICDLIGKLLGFGVQRIGQVAQGGEDIQRFERRSATFHPKDAFQPNDTARPHAGSHGIAVSTVDGVALAKCRAGCKPRPCAHEAFTLGHTAAGQLHPLVLHLAFHAGHTSPSH